MITIAASAIRSSARKAAAAVRALADSARHGSQSDRSGAGSWRTDDPV